MSHAHHATQTAPTVPLLPGSSHYCTHTVTLPETQARWSIYVADGLPSLLKNSEDATTDAEDATSLHLEVAVVASCTPDGAAGEGAQLGTIVGMSGVCFPLTLSRSHAAYAARRQSHACC